MYIQCPTCGIKLSLPEELVGQQVRCPDCQTIFDANIPAPKPIVTLPRATPPPPPPPLEPNSRYSYSTEGTLHVDKAMSRAAVWGFALSFFGIFCLPFFVSVPLTIVGLVKTSNGKMRGFGYALAGLILNFTFPFFLSIVSAIAIPTFLEPPELTNEHTAQQTLTTIVGSQTSYRVRFGRFAPNLATLVESGFLNRPEFANCIGPGVESQPYSGYLFQMTSGREWTSNAFYVRCHPANPNSHRYSFAIDTNGNWIVTEDYY